MKMKRRDFLFPSVFLASLYEAFAQTKINPSQIDFTQPIQGPINIIGQDGLYLKPATTPMVPGADGSGYVQLIFADANNNNQISLMDVNANVTVIPTNTNA